MRLFSVYWYTQYMWPSIQKIPYEFHSLEQAQEFIEKMNTKWLSQGYIHTLGHPPYGELS
jgi:hypothetical protein